MRRQLLNRAFWLLGAVLGTAVTLLALSRDWIEFSDASSPENTDRPLAVGSPAYLIEKHDCWTGAAPSDMEGVLPGHVVLTYPGALAPAYGGTKAVGIALEQLAHDEVIPGDGVDHGVTVHAFCR